MKNRSSLGKTGAVFLPLLCAILLFLQLALPAAAGGPLPDPYAVTPMRGEEVREILDAALSEDRIAEAASRQKISSYTVDRDGAIPVFTVPYRKLGSAEIETADSLLAQTAGLSSVLVPLVALDGAPRVAATITLTPLRAGEYRQTVAWHGASSRTPWDALAGAIGAGRIDAPTGVAQLRSDLLTEPVLLIGTASGDGILSYLYLQEGDAAFSPIPDFLSARIKTEQKAQGEGIWTFLATVFPTLSVFFTAVWFLRILLAVLIALAILAVVHAVKRKKAKKQTA